MYAVSAFLGAESTANWLEISIQPFETRGDHQTQPICGTTCSGSSCRSREDPLQEPLNAYEDNMNYPSDMELLEFFESEPSIDDDVWVYFAQDSLGISLLFSFNVIDDSVQTLIRHGERIVSLISHECLVRMWIDKETVNAEFENNGYKVMLSLTIRPFVRVEWSGIRME